MSKQIILGSAACLLELRNKLAKKARNQFCNVYIASPVKVILINSSSTYPRISICAPAKNIITPNPGQSQSNDFKSHQFANPYGTTTNISQATI